MLRDAQAPFRTRIRFYAGNSVRARTRVELSGLGHIRDEVPTTPRQGLRG